MPDDHDRGTRGRAGGGRGTTDPGTRFTADPATASRATAPLAATPAPPRSHQLVLQEMIAIAKHHRVEGTERMVALQALARSVPAADRPGLHARLSPPKSKDQFAVYFRTTFPQTGVRFLEGLREDQQTAPAPLPAVTRAPAPKFEALTWANVRSNPRYIDNFVNDVNDAWFPNDRLFVFRYERDLCAEITLQSLLHALQVKSELNPGITTPEELRKRFPNLPKDLVVPTGRVPGGKVSGPLPGTSPEPKFKRSESGLIYPSDTFVPRTYLPRIAKAVVEIEAGRVGQELMTANAGRILERIISMEFAAVVGMGGALIRIYKWAKSGVGAGRQAIKAAAPKPKPKPKTGKPSTPKPAARSGFLPPSARRGAPLPPKQRLYRGSLSGKKYELATTTAIDGDAGAGTYFGRDLPTGAEYAAMRREAAAARAAGKPTPHGVVRMHELDTKSVSYLNVAEGPLRADFEKYLAGQPHGWTIKSGHATAPVYHDAFVHWAKTRVPPIDLERFQVIALPEFRMGVTQFCVKDPALVRRLHSASQPVAFATDGP